MDQNLTVSYKEQKAQWQERKIFKTTIFFAVYMLILAVSTVTTGNEWIIWMNYCWIFALTVCFLIRNMADENEWNFWDYLCGGVNAVFGAIGSIARPFGDGNDFARLREKKENKRYIILQLCQLKIKKK